MHFADTHPTPCVSSIRIKRVCSGAGITFDWQPNIAAERDEAVAVARRADVVVAFVGLTPELEGEEMPIQIDGFSGGDRTSISLPKVQQQMLEAVAATGKPVVVIMLNGGAIAPTWAKEHAAAILEAWYPGEEGGTAIANTLAGDSNPAGRLPVTFYASTDQLPAFDDYAMKGRTYRYFDGKPAFGFGFGLSYSHFTYSHLKLSKQILQAGETLTVEADVKNDSARDGDEVAELYLVPPKDAVAPRLALEGFTRVHLRAGETQHLKFALDARQLSTVDERGIRAVKPGQYSLALAAVSLAIRLISPPNLRSPAPGRCHGENDMKKPAQGFTTPIPEDLARHCGCSRLSCHRPLFHLRRDCRQAGASTSVQSALAASRVLTIFPASGSSMVRASWAVCDLDSNRVESGKALINDIYAKKTGKPYTGVTGYHNYHALLANKDIDAVVISTPDHQHAIIAVDAVRAGKGRLSAEAGIAHHPRGPLSQRCRSRPQGASLQIGSQQRSWVQFRYARNWFATVASEI